MPSAVSPIDAPAPPRVLRVTSGSPAERAGLQVGDELLAIDGRSPRDVLEYQRLVDEADIPRFATMGVIASLQPCHLLTDIEAIERLMPHRAARSFPLRDLVESAELAGFEPEELVWLGSDAPIVPPEPGDNLQASVERRRRSISSKVRATQRMRAQSTGTRATANSAKGRAGSIPCSRTACRSTQPKISGMKMTGGKSLRASVPPIPRDQSRPTQLLSGRIVKSAMH